MQRKKLPIGIQTFAKIREDDAYYYVDKTPLALKLIEQGSHFFLSRPRRAVLGPVRRKQLGLDGEVSPEFSSICGYTDNDVDTVFAAELPGLDRNEIRRWYNGYNWRGESVYNPYDLLLLFQEREFAPYWFETGTPTFLIKLLTNDLAGLREVFHAFFASIPNDWYRNNPIAQYEGYWASVFYSYFAALGLDMVLEDVTNQGRIDMAVKFNGQVWLFEFKVVEQVPAGKAIQQLRDKNYAEKYRGNRSNGPVHLVGVEFSKDSRNIVGFDTETLL